MISNYKTLLIFFVIFLEGYVVLSAELLAVRQTIPFVGGGTDTVSIIIAAVLMPLAVGYYAGGEYRGKIRQKLALNFVIAGAFLTLGLSYYVLTWFFESVSSLLDWRNRHLLITLYAVIFLITPVYLLGQTVPLMSNYIRKAHLPKATGKILFYSTLGSFLGSVFTTLFLMNFIGVANTVTVVIGCIAILTIMMSQKKFSALPALASLIFIACIAINSTATLNKIGVVASNAYNTVQIEEHDAAEKTRYLRLNRSYSSAFQPDNPEKSIYRYVDFIDRYFIKAFRRTDKKGNILVIGSGGFTIGLKDRWNDYVFVDIDPDLKEQVEEHFLKEKLSENKEFVGQPARGYLKNTGQTFDLIIMDVARGPAGMPEHLLTKEFFELLKSKLNKDGILVAHMFANIFHQDSHSRYLDTTIRSVFPYVSRQIVDGFTAWKIEPGKYSSLLYIALNDNGEKSGIYTDNLNRAAIKQSPLVPY